MISGLKLCCGIDGITADSQLDQCHQENDAKHDIRKRGGHRGTFFGSKPGIIERYKFMLTIQGVLWYLS
jgi:hypothetical protein